ncbi:MAG: hypothetical protein RL367_2188 [Pseudomonadota bacterium]|jgi:hypothetical protein
MRFKAGLFIFLVGLLGIAIPVVAAGELGDYGPLARGFLADHGLRHIGDIGLILLGVAGLLIGRRASMTATSPKTDA